MEPIRWTNEGVVILDQRLLPGDVVYRTYTDYREVARSIKEMEIRGAPAIGVAAAMGVALGILHSRAKTMDELRAEFAVICETLGNTRPTAVDLFWAIRRFERRFAELAGEFRNQRRSGRRACDHRPRARRAGGRSAMRSSRAQRRR